MKLLKAVGKLNYYPNLKEQVKYCLSFPLVNYFGCQRKIHGYSPGCVTHLYLYNNIQQFQKTVLNMSTLDKIKEHAEDINRKAMKGETLTKDDIKILAIYNSLSSKTAFNAGKRNNNKNVQKP